MSRRDADILVELYGVLSKTNSAGDRFDGKAIGPENSKPDLVRRIFSLHGGFAGSACTLVTVVRRLHVSCACG